jgi:serine protease Do
LLLLGPWTLVQAGGNTPANVTESGPVLNPGAPASGPIEVRRNYIVRAVARVKGAVVNIHSERTVHGPSSDLFALSPSQNRINGMGTGILIDPRGYIVTNHHVVEDVSVIRIRLADGTVTSATVIARNREIDLALLKINVSRPLPIMPLGTARDLMVGEDVIAIGNAFGYEHTVSKGIVSAVKRDVSLNKEISYRSLIQTDASINPGNSGGPLVNINGDLVGVNVAIRAGAQGIGFAIPVDTMIETVGQMLRSRRLQFANDGMTVRDYLDPTTGGLTRTVKVENIESQGSAAEAGLKRGDVLLRVGGVPVLCSFDVDRALLGRNAGEQVPVVYRRDSQERTATLTLKKSTGTHGDAVELVWRKLGVQLVPVGREVVSPVNGQLNGGLQVTNVASGGLAERAGIRKGDILVGLHNWETLTCDNIAYVLLHRDLASFNPLSFFIIREGQVRRGWLQSVE